MIFVQQNIFQFITCMDTAHKWVQQCDTPASVEEELQLCRKDPEAFNQRVAQRVQQLQRFPLDWQRGQPGWKSKLCVYGDKCQRMNCTFVHSRVTQLAIGLLRNSLYKSEACKYSNCFSSTDCSHGHRGDVIRSTGSNWTYLPTFEELGPIGGDRCTSFLGCGWDRYEGPAAPFESYFSCQESQDSVLERYDSNMFSILDSDGA